MLAHMPDALEQGTVRNDLDLGAAVCALIERDPERAWSPDSTRWDVAPERGAFS
jgi:hypothetical protein